MGKGKSEGEWMVRKGERGALVGVGGGRVGG